MKKIRIGVLGGYRGKSMMRYCLGSDDAELVAICDCNDEVLKVCAETIRKENASITLYKSFDEFIKHDMDAVILANYANEHAPFAIRCLKAGLHVMSEVLPVQTMAEAVALIEAAEASGRVYNYAENYCFFPATMEIRHQFRAGKLGEFEYGEGEYLHNCESIWPDITYGQPDHWRNRMSAFYYCTHSMGPLIHITGLRPVRVTGFEPPHNGRMKRMGAQGAPFGIEMVTMENGGIVKSIHGCGPSESSIWYTVYGSLGRAESGREGASRGVMELHVLADQKPGEYNNNTVSTEPKHEFFDKAQGFGHAGSDWYTMHNFIRAIRGEENEGIGIYEALNMFMPGMFAYFSVLKGSIPMDIPDLRDPAVRELWRNDVRCTDPKVAGDSLLPGNSRGNLTYPADLYAAIRAEYDRRAAAKNLLM